MNETEPAAEASASAGRRSVILQIALAVLMGAAALATAYTAYKSSAAGGSTSAAYTLAITKTNDANQKYLEGNQQIVKDEAVFLEYVKAVELSDDPAYEELYAYIRESLMSKELLKGLKWWEKQPDVLPSGESAPETRCL